MSDRPMWKLAPHLLGLASDVARRRLLMSLTVYVDESGNGTPPVFVMAGFIARAEQWEAFNNEWKAVLAEPPSVDAFHMTEASWSGSTKKLSRLFDIIKKHVLSAFVLTLDHIDYDETIKSKFSKRQDSPYFFMYLHMLDMAASWQERNGLNEKMDFIFDKKLEEEDYLKLNHAEIMRLSRPDVKARLATSPLWLDDKEYLPLQAADILSWIFRRWGYLQYQDQPLNAYLKAFLDSIPILRWNFTREYLQTIASSGLKDAVKRGVMTEHQNENSLPFRDVILQEMNLLSISKAKPGQTVQLFSFPATQMKRFQLLRSCAKCGSPHLHRRVGGECLGEG